MARTVADMISNFELKMSCVKFEITEAQGVSLSKITNPNLKTPQSIASPTSTTTQTAKPTQDMVMASPGMVLGVVMTNGEEAR